MHYFVASDLPRALRMHYGARGGAWSHCRERIPIGIFPFVLVPACIWPRLILVQMTCYEEGRPLTVHHLRTSKASALGGALALLRRAGARYRRGLSTPISEECGLWRRSQWPSLIHGPLLDGLALSGVVPNTAGASCGALSAGTSETGPGGEVVAGLASSLVVDILKRVCARLKKRPRVCSRSSGGR